MSEVPTLLLCVGYLLSACSGLMESRGVREVPRNNSAEKDPGDLLQTAEMSSKDTSALLRQMVQELASFRAQTVTQGSLMQMLQLQVQTLQLQLLSAVSMQYNKTNAPESNKRPNDASNYMYTPETAYVRWGSWSCPNGTRKVYSGFVGGGQAGYPGSAVNALCLPKHPVYTDHTRPTTVTDLYGSEYEVSPEPQQDNDVLCAVCLTPRSTVIMVPANNMCSAGWTVEYTGYLMAGHSSHASGTEYVCMDTALEGRYGSKDNRDGKLFYYVIGQCGSLPCPPYDDQRVLSCVVCAKEFIPQNVRQ